jgi:hypothetical protein
MHTGLSLSRFFTEVVSLYGYYLRRTPYFISSSRAVPPEYPQPPPYQGGKSRTPARTNVTSPPPILGLGISNMLEFFEYDKKFENFARGDLEKNFGRWEAGTTIFFWKCTYVFGTRPPCKKVWESIFEGIFQF